MFERQSCWDSPKTGCGVPGKEEIPGCLLGVGARAGGKMMPTSVRLGGYNRVGKHRPGDHSR